MLNSTMSPDVGLIIATFLAFFILPGIAMIESGLVRTKNASDILLRIFTNFSISILIFSIVDFYVFSRMSLFQSILCAIPMTLVLGALAERTRFSVCCLGSLCMSIIIYPIAVYAVWGGGWLEQMGFHDFAGGSIFHILSGCAALVGCKLIGPRIGKYNLDKSVNAICGQRLSASLSGVLITWMGWMGIIYGMYNLHPSTLPLMLIWGNASITMAVSSLVTLCITWLRYGKPDASMMVSSSLASIAISASGIDLITPLGALVMGIISGVVVIFAIEIIDHRFYLDDPVGVIAAHGVCGVLGCLLTGLLALNHGVFYGGSFLFFFIQLSGVVSVLLYGAIASVVMFHAISCVTSLRVSQADEIAGLDFWEHGLSEVYRQGAPVLDPLANEDLPKDTVPTLQGLKAGVKLTSQTIPVENAIPITHKKMKDTNNVSFTQIAIITSELRFEALKDGLEKIGITGMTVTRVLGFGLQKGHTEVYRGAKIRSRLLPKVKIELVVSKIPIEKIVDTAKNILYTGHYGDGKIFIYDVENVVKIRTGEEGYDALQDYPI